MRIIASDFEPPVLVCQILDWLGFKMAGDNLPAGCLEYYLQRKDKVVILASILDRYLIPGFETRSNLTQ